MATTLLATLPANAASLQRLDQSVWWQDVSDLPGYVNMYLYVPDGVVGAPPVVVAPHHCQGTGPGTFNEMSGLVALADQNGFIMIFPEATGQNCWDAGSSRSLTHDGKGDTHAVVQMVRYALQTFNGNANRVYSVGGSSGGIMTEALLGVYPDVFMAGVSYMGVPAGCWAEGYNDVLGKPANGTGQWSGRCAGGNVTKSGREWGDLARSFLPDYAGHRPRLQHWHGSADTVLNFANMAEDIKQWTNVLGLNEAPTGTDTPADGTTRQFWANACGYTVYEAFSLSGVGHSVPFNGNAVAAYFGLDDVAAADPEAAACPGAVPGRGDAAGASGSSGTVGDVPAETPMGAGGANGAGGASSAPPPIGMDGALGSVNPTKGGDATNADVQAMTDATMGAVGNAGNAAPSSDEAAATGSIRGTIGGSDGSNAMANSARSGGCALARAKTADDFEVGTAAVLVAVLKLLRRRRR